MAPTLRATIIIMGLLGCGPGEVSTVQNKGRVDMATIANGVTVILTGDLGSLDVPLSKPLPDVDGEDLQTELEGVVSLTVSSDSGVSASFASSNVVSGTPNSPGEITWSRNT